MEGRVLAVLLGLCGVLVAHAQNTEHKDLNGTDFDLVKFSGLWYESAMATKLKVDDPKGNTVERVGAVLVQPQGKTLVLTTVFDHQRNCVKEHDQALQGTDPATYIVSRESGNKSVRVLFTDYKTCAIMSMTMHNGEATQSVLKLYSRTLDLNDTIVKKFQEVAAANGFSKEDVYLLDRTDLTCVNLLNSKQRNLLRVNHPMVPRGSASGHSNWPQDEILGCQS